MDLKQQLTEDMKQALRKGDKVRLGVLRFLLADIKNFEIDNGEQSEEGVRKIIAKQIKQMREASSDFAKGNREDLVQAELEKITALEEYMPVMMSDEQIAQVVESVIAEKPGVSLAQMGEVIRTVMGKTKGLADGSTVSRIVRAKLSA